VGVLSARDVYTGRVLWRREIEGLDTFGTYYDATYNPDPFDRSYNQVHIPGANASGSNYVTTKDRIYLLIGPECRILDAATGEELERLILPRQNGKAPPNWGFIGIDQDFLIAAVEPIGIPDGRAKVGTGDIPPHSERDR